MVTAPLSQTHDRECLRCTRTMAITFSGKANPAYATVVILARVITRLGAIDEMTPAVVEGFFACDLSYLQTFYRQINELEDEG